jgi:PAS domain S-box-containing protein
MAQVKRREQRLKVEAAVAPLASAMPESELAWLAAMVEFCSDSILSKRLDGTITSWNGAAESMYGYAAAEMIGRSIEILVPEDRLAELRAMDQRLARGERVPPFETVRRTRDGRLIDVALTMSPIFDRAGAPTRPCGAARPSSAISSRTARSACTGPGPTAPSSGRIGPYSTCSAMRARSTSGITWRNSTPTRTS